MLEDFDELTEEIRGNLVARVAARENDARRELGTVFDRARQKQGLSVRELARRMEVPFAQVRRLLHEEVGGSLELRTLYRAADVLGCSVAIQIRPQVEKARPTKRRRAPGTATRTARRV